MRNTDTIPEWEYIALRVRAELGSRLRDFELVPHSQGIILRGRTNTYYAKQLAQHLVMRISRTQVLANEIDVV